MPRFHDIASGDEGSFAVLRLVPALCRSIEIPAQGNPGTPPEALDAAPQKLSSEEKEQMNARLQESVKKLPPSAE
jgi:hypothetical protein